MRFHRRRRFANQPRLAGQLESLENRRLLAGDTVTLVADQVSVRQNSQPAVLNVLGNDLFGDEYTGAREITAVSYGSEGGQIEISGDRRSLIYAPPADFAGSERLTYFVDGSFFTTVDVNVQSPLRPDDYELPPDGEIHELNVLANDPFWAGYTGERKITLVSVTTGESEIEIAPDGRSILYRPSELAAGTDRFVYIVDEIYPASVTIRTPAALEPDTFEVLQNTTQQRLDVLANDPFWAGYNGPRQITLARQESFGDLPEESKSTVEIAADGKSILYTPSDNNYGYDRLYYVVDSRFEASITLYVNRPVQDDSFEIDINTQDHSFDVLVNDRYYSSLQQRYIDVVDRVTSVGESENGGTVRLQPDGQRIIYSAPAGFSGSDTFTYVADGRFPATVHVHVTRPVRDDYLTVYQDTPNQLLRVMNNDFIGNGYTGTKQLTGVSDSVQAADLSIVGSAIQYTPPEGYIGGDSFDYTVDDALDAHVTVSVTPLAQYDSYNFCPQPNQTYTLNVLSNDYFNRGYLGPGLITAVNVLDGGGQATISSDGRSLRFQPSTQNWARIDYTVDNKYSAQAVVYRENHLRSDWHVVDQNGPGESLNVLANDFPSNRYGCSPAGYTGARRITGVVASENGATVQVSADGRSVSYQPPADFVGSDTFTYTVDGTMEQVVQVQVVRRVRDDQVRVQPNQTESLNVLANDLFGADYSGAGRITAVSPSNVGATVAVSPDGSALVYTAAAGFVGTDTVTYTVDGQLKAHVEIDVRPDGESPYPEFDSSAEFQEFLIDDALERYAGLFGQPAYNRYVDAGENAGDDLNMGPTVNGARDFSETNVQVAGIDESDLMEFDADYVYYLAGNDLVILDAWPADELHEVSRTPIVGQVLGQYLLGDRLTVISEQFTWEPPIGWPLPEFADTSVDIAPDFRPYYGASSYETIVTVLDVSDRTDPALVQQTTLEGRHIQSRRVGDYVYVALSNQAIPPGPQIIPDPNQDENTPDWQRTGTYETQEQYLARVRANVGEFVDDALPNYASVGPDGQLVRGGLIHEPEDIFRPLSDGASSLVSLVSLDMTNSEPGLSGSSGVYTNGATQIYASLEHFYIFENGYQAEDGNVTRILQFDWDADDGSARFSAAGLVPGYMLNQFSADEYEGHLRLVTTVSHSYSGNWTSKSENDLFVLHDDGGVLEFVGSLQNLGLGETARSVRFMGPRAFLVTFQDVDPLFGLDVSDPAHPQSVGHLTLPGFSSYMQLIDDNHLLTVGRNTPTGAVGPAQVSLFDVSDLTQPRLIDEFTMQRFSQTEAAVDHHAFGYFARHGLLAVPSIRSYIVRTDEDQDGYAETRSWTTENDLMVFRIDVDAAPGTNQGVQLLAEISHDSAVRRSGYIDDKLFSIADNSIHVVDVADPNTILATAGDLRQTDPDTPPPVSWDAADGILAQAQADLASRMLRPVGAVMPVVAEHSGAGWSSVVRLDDYYFRYQGEGDSLKLVSVGFEFADSGQDVSWQNPVDADDVNNDGRVELNDAVLLINQLSSLSSQRFDDHPVLRQIGDVRQPNDPYWDANGDGAISALDVLTVVERFNETAMRPIDTGPLSSEDPTTLADLSAVEAFYGRVMEKVGDANLDGRFSSEDLIEVLSRNKYEDDVPGNASWEDGDWDGDGDFTSSDLMLALAYGHYSSEARSVDWLFAE